jgi:hypothetical protein
VGVPQEGAYGLSHLVCEVGREACVCVIGVWWVGVIEKRMAKLKGPIIGGPWI